MGLFSGKDILQSNISTSYPYADSPKLDLTSYAVKSDMEGSEVAHYLESMATNGSYRNLQFIYNRAEQEIWEDGLTKVLYETKKEILPVDLMSKISLIADPVIHEDITDIKVQIDYPSANEWMAGRRTTDDVKYAYPEGTSSEIKDYVKVFHYESLNGQRIDDRRFETREVTSSGSKWKYHMYSPNPEGFIDVELEKPTDELYYIFIINNTWVLIINYDENNPIFPELEYLKENLTETDFTCFPVVPMKIDGKFLNPLVEEDYDKVQNGKIVVQSHRRYEAIQQLSEEDRHKHTERQTMLRGLGISNEIDLLAGYIDAAKIPYPFIKEGFTDTMTAMVAELNSKKENGETWWDISFENKEPLAEVDILDMVHNYTYVDHMAKWTDSVDEITFNTGDVYETKKEEFLSWNNDKRQTEEQVLIAKQFIQSDILDMSTDIEDKEDSLKGNQAMFASVGLNLKMSKQNQAVNKMIFKTFELFYQDKQNEKITYKFIEGTYNKAVSFTITEAAKYVIPALAWQHLAEDMPTQRESYTWLYDKNEDDYTIQRFEQQGNTKNFLVTAYKIHGMRVATEIKALNLHATVEHSIKDNEISLPILWKLFLEMSPLEKTELSSECISIETYQAKKIHLKWYQTPGFMKLMKIAMYAYFVFSLIAAIPTGGGSIEVYAAIEAMAWEFIKDYAIAKLTEYAVDKLIDDPVLKAIIYAAIAMWTLDTSGMSSMNSLLAKTSATLQGVNQYYAAELAIVKEESDEYNEKMAEWEEELANFGEDMDKSYIDPIKWNTTETSTMFYERTLSLELDLGFPDELEIKYF